MEWSLSRNTMNISARCEYACRAIVELGTRFDAQTTVTSQEIAERRHIPEKYLVHILLQLKRAGLVRSQRGSQGGYLLARPPEEVCLLDIVEAIDGGILDPLPVDDSGTAALRPAWEEVAKGIRAVLSETTVRTLMEKASSAEMYYI
jgi:Rrf2 family protein